MRAAAPRSPSFSTNWVGRLTRGCQPSTMGKLSAHQPPELSLALYRASSTAAAACGRRTCALRVQVSPVTPCTSAGRPVGARSTGARRRSELFGDWGERGSLFWQWAPHSRCRGQPPPLQATWTLSRGQHPAGLLVPALAAGAGGFARCTAARRLRGCTHSRRAGRPLPSSSQEQPDGALARSTRSRRGKGSRSLLWCVTSISSGVPRAAVRAQV